MSEYYKHSAANVHHIAKRRRLRVKGKNELASYGIGLGITLAGINLNEADFLLSITIGPSIMCAAQISTKTP